MWINKEILTKLRQKKDVSEGKKQGEVTWGHLDDDVARSVSIIFERLC